ncbi:HU family DNA-binding protein [Mycoplasma mycoides subsp. mycoides]|uniref:DNA-binding protein n=2 Tax=Mycoplasma mycoides subsp. mycoides TaxID=2103 RepID=Q6MU31_MYCMS|nr:HU family DNA-binding protein [Mycoplasma mycoides]QQY78413.1 HU family DNA-binding protein [Mycoplasma mycoides subsp. capri]CAE76855.1 Hypothetical protein MSC_0210 [Mycoplasma mycoides subsp. mycoides SC str. PG1]ADK69610.1 conserved hypothetical protein [Mycoplasma mycoides subsp. mycoides SC str. Gladysdale]AIZ55060.1 DNA-binding protein HU [Mycoplasma mycoides subsp. mycoides]AME10413.1 hypothetical protein MmmBen_0222 [Mycoplasma mycoides subsp. mycoides]
MNKKELISEIFFKRKTGEQIIIPASKTAKFKPAKKLKELLTEQ